MGRKVFISYKYRDFTICPLEGYSTDDSYTRGYVDFLADKLELSDNIYKGEEGSNDLSGFSDEYIERVLKDRITDSSVTVILISPGMRVDTMKERDQWIPWEVSYSLKEITREDRTSHTNAILGVVLPDVGRSYNYTIEKRKCCPIGCRWHNTDWLFTILRKNTFNKLKPNCGECASQKMIYHGEYSYMPILTWDEFVAAPSDSIERVCRIRDEHLEEYKIHKTIEA